NYESTLLILETLDLNAKFHYKTTTGIAFNDTIRDTLFHVINHSTYHRGQIAMEFSQHGLEPLATDFIFYKRLFLIKIGNDIIMLTKSCWQNSSDSNIDYTLQKSLELTFNNLQQQRLFL